MPKFEEEPGIRRRFLYCFQKLKERLPDISEGEFMQSIGYKSKTEMHSLKVAKTNINLKTIFNAARKYPEFDPHYIILSPDLPEVNILKLKPGRVPKPKPPKKAWGRPRKIQVT
ncbi:hypothetical protein AHMF7605_12040 [Adhaeribacter arboris]|uniref:Uncharacterized protein n=1 Tax=Adhaeribacter arboris TaxID=2072846 RepID=A0A2T2YFA9_9BACT|nr:hypothetical protein [Adhaeribacter arboris]PSR54201.1 hypothetical protein AHMF7605_12040 [Adhaeribacter arboris]